jgi:DNA-binding LacI/PurR family transcriptional regulator
MGMEVMRLMTDILKNKSRTSKKVLVPVELIVRKSTAPLK